MSVSFIVRTKSVGGSVPVGNAPPRGLLPPARSFHVDSGCYQKGGLAGIPRGIYSHQCVRGWCLLSRFLVFCAAGAVRPASRSNRLYNPRTDRTSNSEHQRHRTSQESPGHHGNYHIPPSAEVRIYQKKQTFLFVVLVCLFLPISPPYISCVLVFNRTVTRGNWHDAHSAQAIWINGDITFSDCTANISEMLCSCLLYQQ